MNLKYIIVSLLLPASASSACINCGGADKTSAKRLKMPNKSVFTRLSGIELMEIMEITNQKNHEVCAQRCDADTACAVFEFNLPNKLCVLASEYARLSDDLAKNAFQQIVFVKVRGKFTKSLPRDKEVCLDKSEYEEYVKEEVGKWLNPTPRKISSASGTDSGTHTKESGASTVQTSSSTGSTISGSTSAGSGTPTGIGSAHTQGSAGTSSGGNGGTTTTVPGATTGGSSPQTGSPSTTGTSAADTSTTTTRPSTTSMPITTTTTPPAATVTSAPLLSSTSASTPARSDSSVTTASATVSKKNSEDVQRSTDGTTQSTSTMDERTTQEGESSTPLEDIEDPSSKSPIPASVDPSTTTASDGEEVPTTTEPEDEYVDSSVVTRGQNPPKSPIGKWRISAMLDASNLRAMDEWSVKWTQERNKWSQWSIQNGTLIEDQIVVKSAHDPSRYLSADSMGGVKLSWRAMGSEHWMAVDNGEGTWSFKSIYSKWLAVEEGGEVEQHVERSKGDRFMLEPWN